MIVKIADTVIDFHGENTDFYNARMKDYKIDSSEKPEMYLESKYVDGIFESHGIEIDSFEKDGCVVKIYKLNEFTNELVNFSSKGIPISKIRYSTDYSDVRIEINKRMKLTLFSLSDYEYLLTGEWFTNFITTKGGLMLHSSSIKYNDKAILYSGNPGAGKSTQTSLWENYYGQEISVINDDKPVIRFVNDKAIVYGTPWSGKTDKNSNISAELEMIVFVVQAPNNSVKELKGIRALTNVYSQIQNPYYDKNLIDTRLKLVEKILNSYSIYELSCTISKEAVDLIKTKMDRRLK